MTGEKLLEKLELADPAYVQAASGPPAAKKRPWTRWAAGAAACVCLLASAAAVAAGFAVRELRAMKDGDGQRK